MPRIKIKSCVECNDCKVERDYTADSFEHCQRYDCNINKKNIARYVDWNDKDPGVPKWCPKRS